jgi:hypothetical protein
MQLQDRNSYVFNEAQITAEQAKKVMTWNTPLDISIEFLRARNDSVLREKLRVDRRLRKYFSAGSDD